MAHVNRGPLPRIRQQPGLTGRHRVQGPRCDIVPRLERQAAGQRVRGHGNGPQPGDKGFRHRVGGQPPTRLQGRGEQELEASEGQTADLGVHVGHHGRQARHHLVVGKRRIREGGGQTCLHVRREQGQHPAALVRGRAYQHRP
ncbi:hypothetical protein ACFW17_30370 [Streptomyces sp. NPDC058961]|uniref:hypothetical protein n=1 Tax=Streptomyces sp. NPDC058961 TaxID=3346680 RepID=UPI0036CEBC4A